jgi:hypothetical protein
MYDGFLLWSLFPAFLQNAGDAVAELKLTYMKAGHHSPFSILS